MAATLAYNRHVTGSLLDFPIAVVDPMDTFGFGPRRLMPEFPVTDYSPRQGCERWPSTASSSGGSSPGSYLGLGVAAVGPVDRASPPSTLALLLVGARVPLGLLPVLGHGGLVADFTRLSGPLYYLPLFACIAVLVAMAVVHVHGTTGGPPSRWSWLWCWRRSRPRAAA